MKVRPGYKLMRGEEEDTLLGQHVLGLLVAECDFVDGVSAVLQGNVVAVDVRRQEDF